MLHEYPEYPIQNLFVDPVPAEYPFEHPSFAEHRVAAALGGARPPVP